MLFPDHSSFSVLRETPMAFAFGHFKRLNVTSFEDVLSNQGEFFLIWRIWIIPLFVIREAIAEGAVASHLAVRAEAASGHEWRSQIDDGY
jgi:hypothetical protein